MKVTAGSFGPFGASADAQGITLTFEFQKADEDAVAFYDSHTFQPVAEIGVKKGRVIGHVCSMRIETKNPSDLCYLMKIGGKYSLDPYATRIAGRDKWNDAARETRQYQVYGGFSDGAYEWTDGDFKPLSDSDIIIYKLHMRGFTMQHKLAVRDKGNVRGFLKRLGEIQDLGFTAVEFMPIYDFEEMDLTRYISVGADGTSETIISSDGKVNYWGYGEASYFAPKASYFGGDKCSREMKHMVDEIHARGMEIYMEMSYAPDTPDDVIVASLIHWVKEYHVDGFHFLGMGIPVQRIVSNPYLADTRLFYDLFPREILDAQKGRKHLYVCNNDFMYALRRLQNHQDGSMQDLAGQMKRQGADYGFVNYAANNDGFTLYDAYSYGEKHNEANGEDNRDGSNYNCSSNYGVEGKTSSSAVTSIRLKSVRTALATVLLSQGIPMVLSGDEVLNTQEGNNNAYCQDNPTGWVQFFNGRHQKQLREFVRRLTAFRKEHPILSMEKPFELTDYRHLGMPDLSYHGREPWMVSIGQEKKALGVMYNGAYADDEDILVCFNFHYEWENFALPHIDGKKWYIAGNTMNYDIYAYVDSPEAKASFRQPVLLEDQSEIIVEGGSVSVLVSCPEQVDSKDLNEAKAETERTKETSEKVSAESKA